MTLTVKQQESDLYELATPVKKRADIAAMLKEGNTLLYSDSSCELTGVLSYDDVIVIPDTGETLENVFSLTMVFRTSARPTAYTCHSASYVELNNETPYDFHKFRSIPTSLFNEKVAYETAKTTERFSLAREVLAQGLDLEQVAAMLRGDVELTEENINAMFRQSVIIPDVTPILEMGDTGNRLEGDNSSSNEMVVVHPSSDSETH